MNLTDPKIILKQRCTGIPFRAAFVVRHIARKPQKSARKYGKAGTTPRRLTAAGFLAQFKEEG